MMQASRCNPCGPIGARWAVVAALAQCLVVIGGCQKGPVPTYPVTGEVVFAEGTPLPGGNIELAPRAGEVKASARGVIEEDGAFRLSTFIEGDGAVAGEHAVLIIPARQRGERPGASNTELAGKYQDFATSGLTAVVKPEGPNEFRFVVEPARK